MRGSLKRLAEGLLVNLLPLSRPAARLRGRALVLALHNVVSDPASAGLDASLHLSLESLSRLLDALDGSHRFVALEQILGGIGESSERLPVAVTFDDAYRGALRNALPLLARRGIPVTIFAVPGRLGHPGMWWDTLRDPGGSPLSASQRERALEEGRGAEEAVRRLAARSGWQSVLASSDVGFASLDELRASCAVSGVTIASHTWSHPNLTRLSDPELQEELVRSAEWLRAEAGAAWRPWLAYPYGLTDARVVAAARAAGYTAAFRVAGGWTRRPPEDPLDAPRLNVPAGLTPNGIRLRGAGLFC